MKKICVVTSTRADYGLLFWTMKGIEKSLKLELQLVVTGMHLDEKFGHTVDQIFEDGFHISSQVSLGNLDNTRINVIEQISVGIKKFANIFVDLQPDVIMILGDRYEMLAVAQAALFLKIPIAHIHGGEVTEGAFDDSVRHAITKLSYLHFTSAEEYRQRVIQLGEHPSRVFNVGAPGLENITKLNLLSQKQLSESLEMTLQEQNFLVTYHPETMASVDKGLNNLLKVLDEYDGCGIVITMPNCDPGHSEILEKIEKFADTHSNVKLFSSLGQLRYLSAMKNFDVVIGNSSSGVIEAPFFPTPTVNIGDRQKGRVISESVFCCGPEVKDIQNGLRAALLFNNKVPSCVLGDGNVSSKIIKKLERFDLTDEPKVFYNL